MCYDRLWPAVHARVVLLIGWHYTGKVVVASASLDVEGRNGLQGKVPSMSDLRASIRGSLSRPERRTGQPAIRAVV